MSDAKKRKVELDEHVVFQVTDWQHANNVRSLGKAVAALIEKGLQLDASERLGMTLTREQRGG